MFSPAGAFRIAAARFFPAALSRFRCCRAASFCAETRFARAARFRFSPASRLVASSS
jgi:hypothetical protein